MLPKLDNYKKIRSCPSAYQNRYMGLSPISRDIFCECVSCFDIGEVPKSPGKWKWNRLSILPFSFSFEQCVMAVFDQMMDFFNSTPSKN